MTKFRLLTGLLITFVAAPPPARAGWERVATELPREPVRALTATGGTLVVVGVRLASIAEVGAVRRAFTLASQTDALVGFVATGAAWYLASRRALWRSDDRGYSWQKVAALPPRDTNVILAVGAEDGAPLVATTEGLRRPGPAGLEPYGPFGRTKIAAAAGKDGRLLVTTGRGLFVAGAGEPRRVALAGGAQPRAFIAEAGGVWLASETGVLHCAPACRGAAALTGVRDLAHTPAGYFAAATDGVYRLDGAAPATLAGGLDGAPAALAAAGETLYAATAQGLFRLVADAPPAAAPADPADALVAEPGIADVRRMVLAAHPFLRDETTGWRDRARWRAAAPRVGVSVNRSLDEKSGLTRGDTIALSTTENRLLIGPNGEATSRASGRAVDYGLTLTWELEELVFNPLEINVSNELEDLFRLRESIVIDVTRVYFDRLRVRRQLAVEIDLQKRADLALRLGELTAQLDFYTNGRFTAAAAPEAP